MYLYYRDRPSTSAGAGRCVTPVKKRKIRHELGKQKCYDQKFKREWLEKPQFKGWLREHISNEHLCHCAPCDCDLRCGKSELQKHLVTEKHKKNVAKMAGVVSVGKFFQKKTIHSKKVSEAEIELSAFFAHHNVAFQVIEHLVPVLKDCFADSEVLKDIKLGRTKTTNIFKNVIAKKETEKLSAILKNRHFSILVDESTDISVNKLLCIGVKYVNDSGVICDQLLELITINAKNCDAEHLYEAFKSCLELKGIPLKNIIGFASDNVNVMVGKNNSFFTRLQADTEALIMLPCICHSGALVASNACSKLPRIPEEFVRSIASYFSYSAKRTAELSEMQEFFQLQQKKMLKLSVTRWLSMQDAVNRVLEYWDMLFNFFQLAKLEDNSKSIDFIFTGFNNKCTK